MQNPARKGGVRPATRVAGSVRRSKAAEYHTILNAAG